jgi:hypothetical protein
MSVIFYRIPMLSGILVNDFKDIKVLSKHLLQILPNERLARKHTDWRPKKLAHHFTAMLRRSKRTKACEICDVVRARNSSKPGLRKGSAILKHINLVTLASCVILGASTNPRARNLDTRPYFHFFAELGFQRYFTK